MSGIAGIVRHRGGAPDAAELEAMLDAVAHRGTGAGDTWAEGPAALGSRGRGADGAAGLATRDDGDLVLAVDAWLPAADLDAILADWSRRGPDCLPDLDGSFSLAAWDRRRRVLWLARDAHGTRPLVWTRDGGRFAFASEVHGLLALPWTRRRLATDHLAEYLSFRYVHAPRTLFQDIHAVPPGHVLRVDAHGERVDRWWAPRWAPVGTRPPEPREVVSRVDTGLARAVARRMPADEPVALLLSGGLDSSAILYHARQQPGPAPLTFTVALDDDPADESALASRVAGVFKVEHELVRVSHADLVEAVRALTTAMGQPLPSAAAAVQYLLYRHIGDRARIVLSGDGGDEVLGGRGMERIAARIRAVRLLDRLPGPARELTRVLARRTGRRDLAASHAHFGRDRGIGGSRVFHSAERVAILRDPAMVRPGIRRTVLEPLYQEVDSDAINAILYVWQRGWLPEDSLARSDRAATRAGVEVRYPMLDRELVRFTSALPGDAKVVFRGPRVITKWALREAMRDRLPRPLLERPKRSMPNPLDHWLRNPGREFLRAGVDALCSDETGLFTPSEVRRLADEHLAGRANHGLKLWTLILFQLWKDALCD